MPWHVHPRLRAIEEYRESSGRFITLDSVGVTRQKDAESASVHPKVVPVKFVSYYLGTVYTAT